MKVLHVNDYATAGGAEVVMAATVDLLRRRGVVAQTFTAADLPSSRRSALRYVDSPAARRALSRRLAAFRPDAIHLHNFYHALSPGILATLGRYRRSSGARVVMTAHDYHLVCPNAGLFHLQRGRIAPADTDSLRGLSYLVARRWDRRGTAHSLLKVAQHAWNYRLHRRREVLDCVLCPSRFLEAVMRRHGLPTRYVPYPAPDAAPAADRPRDGLTMLFAGRLEPEKGLARFLELVPPAFPLRLTVAGDGADRSRCEAVCRRRGLADRVVFAGRLPRQRVLALTARSHVLLLPSLWPENLPLCLLEALVLGTNLLVSDLGAMRELVAHAGVGFTFSPDSASSLAAALERIRAAWGDGTLTDYRRPALLNRCDPGAYAQRVLESYAPSPAPEARVQPCGPPGS